MTTFFCVTPFREVAVCKEPSKDCLHRHHSFLASAARELAVNYKREYHLDETGEISLCKAIGQCDRGDHFLTRQEIVRHHRKNFDFFGPYRPLVNPYSSLLENEFSEFVEKFNFETIRNSKNVIGPHEIDLYLPDFEVAFEFNGTFWHSEEKIQERYGMSSRDYHFRKKALCEDQGIHLNFVWEDNWRQSWVTVIDAACEAIQFRRESKVLSQLSRALAPLELHFEEVDRSGMERARKRLTNRKLREHSKKTKALQERG